MKNVQGKREIVDLPNGIEMVVLVLGDKVHLLCQIPHRFSICSRYIYISFKFNTRESYDDTHAKALRVMDGKKDGVWKYPKNEPCIRKQ